MLHALRRSHTTATLAVSPTSADAPPSPALPAPTSPPNRASSAAHIVVAADPASPGGSSSAGDRSELASPGALSVRSLRSTATADSVERPWTRGDAPRHAYSLEYAFAYLNYGHRERQHIFRLCTKAHGAFYFQALTANDASLWCGPGASGGTWRACSA